MQGYRLHGLIAGTLAIFIIAVTGTLLFQLTRQVTSHADIRSSESYLSIIREVQAYYSSEVLGPMRKQGVSVQLNYATTPHSAPFPATFTHGLVQRLSSKDDEADFRFFSEYPFVDRPNAGPKDAFERDALAYFAANPNSSTFSRLENSERGELSRTAVAIRMVDGCTECHNSFAESPKQDWKVGDLRGALAVAKDVNMTAAMLDSEFFVPLAFLGGVLIVSLVSLVGGVGFVSKRNAQLARAKTDIEELASKDFVADIANRRHFMNIVDDWLNEDEKRVSVITFDLRGFKSVNDIHGHGAGDLLLQEVANRLEIECPDGGVAARLGGDEFAVAFETLELDPNSLKFAAKLIDKISEPYVIHGKRVHVTGAAGIAHAPEHGRNATDILASADLAMYAAREMTSPQICLYDARLRAHALTSDALVEALRNALTENQFELYYQPQTELQSGHMCGLEALIRWNDPIDGLQTPGRFLPTARNYGLAIAISKRVLEIAIADIMRWRNLGLEIPKIAINLDPDQLRDSEHLMWLRREIQNAGISPNELTLEVTEECVLGRSAGTAAEALLALRKLGFGISLDDFGTGYASLSHIKSLPVSELKIDRSFVRNVVTDEVDRTIVTSLLKLAKSLDVEIVAEGVETIEQAAVLARLGCPKVQGYLFGRPQPFHMISKRLPELAPARENTRLSA